MAELEKKYSDFQQSECKDLEQPQVIDEKVCPTCEPDPSFKLEREWWDIEKAYLNKNVCEYRVRVYEAEVLQENAETNDARETAIKIGILKILAEYGKPFNDGIKIQLENAAAIADTYYNTGSRLLGVAYLVSVPAFNFDQIPSPEDIDEPDPNEEEIQPSFPRTEFVVPANALGIKIHYLSLTLKTYSMYYGLAQRASDSFVIRQEEDIVQRINYDNTRKKLRKFKRLLDEALNDSGYADIGGAGQLIARKQLKRVKFVFKAGRHQYELEDVYALSEQCPDSYEKLNIGPTNELRSLEYEVIYNFYKNIDKIHNDITAKETKPWLEWTLEHFYPTYIADRGNLEEVPPDRVGLDCLLEEQLGLGQGRVLDSLAREIMSAFDLIELDYNSKACRELDRLGEANNPQDTINNASLARERKEKMLARYKQEFINKALDQKVKALQEFKDQTGIPGENATRANIFKLLQDSNYRGAGLDFEVVEVQYTVKNKETKAREDRLFSAVILNEKDLEQQAIIFSQQKFQDLEGGNFVDRGQNSPHYYEALESAKEVRKVKGGFIDDVKDAFSGASDFEPLDMINIIGLCGISKITGKALDCLANGITFDAFLDILISKTFDHIKVNTLELFFNGLPYSFREELTEAIRREFGPNVDLSDLFGIKTVEDGDEKLKDFVRSKFVAKRVKELFEKYQNPLAESSEAERELLVANLGENEDDYNSIIYVMEQAGFSRETKIYPTEKISRAALTMRNQAFVAGLQVSESLDTKMYKPETYVLKYIKYVMRGRKVAGGDFADATARITNAVGNYIGDRISLRADVKRLNEQIQAEKDAFETLLTTQNVVFNEDGTIQSWPTSNAFLLEEGRRLMERVKDYRQVQATVYEQIDDIRLSTLAKQKADEIEQLITSSAVDFAVGIVAYRDNFFPTLEQSAENIFGDYVITADELDKYELAQKSFQETALGVKVDIVFDIVFDYVIDAIMEEFSLDELFDRLKSYPVIDFGLDMVSKLELNCPNSPIIYPPPGDFLKSLSVDVCDPTFSLSLPQISIPSIDWRYQIQKQFSEIFKEAILKLVADIIGKIALKSLGTLESALCNVVESAGGLVANGLDGDVGNSFLNALDEAFCNDGENPATSRKRAEELADALFSPLSFDSGVDPTGSGEKVAGIIGSVSTTNEVLGAMVSREGEENEQFNERVANAVNILAPEMRSLLGSPNQVAYFFSNLGSHLSPDDRERIRDLLDADIPNLPVSNAICLTNEELEDWNDLRNRLLQDQGFTPEQAADRVRDLNNKAEKALEDIMDTAADLDSDAGPFEEALAEELNKDPCRTDNPINPTSADQLSQQIENQLVDGFYDNISRSITIGMTGRNSIFGEALKDFEGRREFGRKFFRLFNKNIQNSQDERDIVRGEKGFLAGKIMDALTDSDQVISQYPTTVGIVQREKILEDDAKIYNSSKNAKNIIYRFVDSSEDSDFSFTQDIAATNNRRVTSNFNYQLRVQEKLDDQPYVTELGFTVPVGISEAKERYMESVGFQYRRNENEDVRRSFFNSFCNSAIPVNKDYSSLYYESLKEMNKGLVELMMTDPRQEDGIPLGYKFGYVVDNLTTDSFTYYNPDGVTPYDIEESEKTLGKFGNDRIVALDPAKYGGRYSNPPYFVEPRVFTGWMELATKAFDSPSGCDPKQPPLISFGDIKDRTKDLGQQLREDPRLGQDPECFADKPFNLLLDKKTKSKLDGVVRTTLRTYITEYFLKGYGLFSNLELETVNFDQGLFIYLAQKMKSEMRDLGTSFSNNRITIVREKYWYTFLEQCVEAYQRTIDVDGVTPPENVKEALNSIQRGLDKYIPINSEIKKRMRKTLKELDNKIPKPSKGYDPLEVVSQGPVPLGLQAIAFRLTTDEEEKRDFFNASSHDGYTAFKLRFASVKKLKFFQKIYFIALYEREAMVVMSEMIRQEASRLYSLIVDGLNDKPTIKFLDRALLSTMPNSTSRIGFSQYYVDKQTSSNVDPGAVGEISDDSSTTAVEETSEPQFILESYARMVNKVDPTIPPLISNRPFKYVGAIPLSRLSEFVSENLDLIEDNYLSDFFGDLSFSYEGSLLSLMQKGFTSDGNMQKLNELNGGTILSNLKEARNKFVTSQTFEDIEVTYDESFLLEGETPEPSGTLGSTGVKYGLRLSILLPKYYFSDNEILLMRENPEFMTKSKRERAFLFDDNSFILPLISEEVDVVDTKFTYFDPYSGTERYDLECLINKMVERPEFKLMMENIFNVKQCSSMLSMYCMETMMPSIGRKVAPESEDPAEANDSENYERSFGKEADPEEEWDGTINKFGKNFLRREFKSMYLSRSPDGLSTDNDDDDDSLSFGISGIFGSGSPFDYLSLPSVRIPWWRKRKLKTKIYDANGMECVDPEKDLE